jgi:hypothetical protein
MKIGTGNIFSFFMEFVLIQSKQYFDITDVFIV